LERAKRDGVPAYVVLNDRHLLGIAAARPSSARELAACDGIGPTKLERYGDEILALLETLAE
jgi:superfamily II DNA helicase RecQ